MSMDVFLAKRGQKGKKPCIPKRKQQGASKDCCGGFCEEDAAEIQREEKVAVGGHSTEEL